MTGSRPAEGQDAGRGRRAELVEDPAEARTQHQVEHVALPREQSECLLARESHDGLPLGAGEAALPQHGARHVHGPSQALGAPLLVGHGRGIGPGAHPSSLAPGPRPGAGRPRPRLEQRSQAIQVARHGGERRLGRLVLERHVAAVAAVLEQAHEATEVGLAVAGWLFCAGIANFGGPMLAERVGRTTVIVTGALVAGSALTLLALLPSHPAWLLGVAAFGGGSFAPLLMTYPLQIEGIGLAKAGAAIGLLTLIGQLGGFLLPVLASTLVGEGGHFDHALAALAVVHLAIVVPALLVARRAPTPIAVGAVS